MCNKGKKLVWNEKAQEAFDNIKRELCEAPVLGMPTEKGMYVLDTDTSVVVISSILHQKREWNGQTVRRLIKSCRELSDIEKNYGAPRVNNRALSWLKTFLIKLVVGQPGLMITA